MDQKKKKEIRILTAIFMILYLLLLFYVCFFSEKYGRAAEGGEYRYNLEPFREIIRYYTNLETLGFGAVFSNLLGNVIAFIPFGFFLPILRRIHKSFFATLFYTFLLSLLIETVQLVTKVGAFDVDDLILNTLGGVVGYILFQIVNRIRRNRLGKTGI